MSESSDKMVEPREPVASDPPAEKKDGPSATTPAVPSGARHDEDKPSDAAASADQKDRIPGVLPILPIRDSVAYPGTIMPLSIGRDKSKRLIEQAGAGDKMIGVIAQRRKETEDPGIEDLYRVGTACAILKVLNLPDGTLSIIVHGLTRFGLVEMVQTEPFLLAQVQTHDDPIGKSPELDALVHTARQAAYRIFELSPNVPDEARIILDNIDSPGGVADFLAANLSVGLINRQELLETFDVGDRLRKINTALAEQVQLLELSNKIQTQVRQQIDKSQREYYLQEQLKAIQKELGEGDGRSAELDRLRERIQAAKMPDAAPRGSGTRTQPHGSHPPGVPPSTPSPSTTLPGCATCLGR